MYQVTDDGRVWSNRSKRFLSQYPNNHGYMTAKLFDGKGTSHYVHRLVARAFLPNLNNLPVVNHKDFDRANNHVDNLEWCTPEYNYAHAVNSDRPNGKRKLTAEDVKVIRLKHSQGVSQVSLIDEYHVSPGLMSGIVNRSRWKHI